MTETLPIGLHSTKEELIAATEYVVEATRYEEFALWKEFNNQIKWGDINFGGYGIYLGNVGNMPVMLSIRFQQLNNHLVMFYEPTSQMVDWRMVEEWIDRVPIVAQKGKRDAQSDAMNFRIAQFQK